jgi:hypothetical protein
MKTKEQQNIKQLLRIFQVGDLIQFTGTNSHLKELNILDESIHSWLIKDKDSAYVVDVSSSKNTAFISDSNKTQYCWLPLAMLKLKTD